MDYFVLLGQPRVPWIDPGPLKAAFLARSAEAHPDRVHGGSPAEKEDATARYAGLNAAYNCLREPKDRLAYLLELETGQRPADAQPPADAGAFFFSLAPVLQEAGRFLKEHARAVSPLAKARLFAAGLQWTDRLQGLQQQIQLRREKFEAELREMNAAWEKSPDHQRAAELYAEFSFLKRWSEQVQELLARLASDE